MKKTLIQKLGLLGVVSFLSYMAAGVIRAAVVPPGITGGQRSERRQRTVTDPVEPIEQSVQCL